jgi:hypothetical protein
VTAHNGGVEAQNGAVEFCITVVADSHHFDGQQDPDPDPHRSGKRGPTCFHREKVKGTNFIQRFALLNKIMGNTHFVRYSRDFSYAAEISAGWQHSSRVPIQFFSKEKLCTNFPDNTQYLLAQFE